MQKLFSFRAKEFIFAGAGLLIPLESSLLTSSLGTRNVFVTPFSISYLIWLCVFIRGFSERTGNWASASVSSHVIPLTPIFHTSLVFERHYFRNTVLRLCRVAVNVYETFQKCFLISVLWARTTSRKEFCKNIIGSENWVFLRGSYEEHYLLRQDVL